MVRHPEVEQGFIELDPATLREGEAGLVPPAVRRAVAHLGRPGREPLTFAAWQDAALGRLLSWPD
jgi:hypothetical protein